MKLYKPKFWEDKRNILSIILYPFSIIYKTLSYFKKSFTKSIKFKTYVICVGNINLGGTGKTPLTIFIANFLKRSGKKTAVIRKFYKNHADEHLMIKEYFEDLLLSNNRSNAINNAVRQGFKYVVLDDGFQDYSIKKNINIICFNSEQLIGNGFIFPSGPLRDDIASLKDANIVLINGNKVKEFEEKILKINKSISIYYSKYEPVNIEEFRNKSLLAFAGIANPKNFFNLLEKNNLKVSKKMVFPDHYRFSKKEILRVVKFAEKNSLEIIMTEKDYFKVKKFNLTNLKFLKVKLKIENENNFLKNILVNDNEII